MPIIRPAHKAIIRSISQAITGASHAMGPSSARRSAPPPSQAKPRSGLALLHPGRGQHAGVARQGAGGLGGLQACLHEAVHPLRAGGLGL